MKTLLTGLLGLMFLAGGVAAAEDRGRDRDRSAIDSEVIRTRLVTRECGRCEGRRRDSDGLGVFRVETRLYTEYRRGHAIRSWRETDEYFDHCVGWRERVRWD